MSVAEVDPAQPYDLMSSAKFGEYIAVEITCIYTPITPGFLRMGKTIPINVKILMCSEAN